MHNAQDWIAPALTLLAAVYAFFRHREGKPTDTERAELLRVIAEDVAALVTAAFPGKSWAELVNAIVQRLLALPGVPTRNTAALEAAASSALLRMGHSPDGK